MTDALEKATNLKQQAMNTNPSPMEKTMTPSQLFVTNNPLWALGFTVPELFLYFSNRDKYKDYETFYKFVTENKTIVNNYGQLLLNSVTGVLSNNRR